MSKPSPAVRAALFLAGALVLAACGGSATPASTPTPVVVVVTATAEPAAPSPVATATAPASPTPEAAAPTTYDDAFAYCAAVGTIDEPDERYTGVEYPDAVINGLEAAVGAPGGQFRGPNAPSVFPWRCMDGQVWACYPGVNLPCYKADTSREPTEAAREECQRSPEGPGPSLSATGHGTIYAWECRGGEPVITGQVSQVDPQGYVADYWYRISP